MFILPLLLFSIELFSQTTSEGRDKTIKYQDFKTKFYTGNSVVYSIAKIDVPENRLAAGMVDALRVNIF